MFTVIELQTNNGTTTAQHFNFADENQANQKYHEILMYASVSTVDIHSAAIIDCRGYVRKNEYYEHNIEPEPEN
jgi:hypothetical protein